MKCYTARIEIEVMLTADDERDAREAALRALRHDIAWQLQEDEITVSKSRCLAMGWEGGHYVWGDHTGDLTAAEALKLNRDASGIGGGE